MDITCGATAWLLFHVALHQAVQKELTAEITDCASRVSQYRMNIHLIGKRIRSLFKVTLKLLDHVALECPLALSVRKKYSNLPYINLKVINWKNIQNYNFIDSKKIAPATTLQMQFDLCL